ncbi:unnamed protein product [Prunus armeniaca]
MAMVAIAACPRAPFLLLFSIKVGPFSFATKAMTKGNGEAYVLHYGSGLAWCGRVVPSGVVWDARAFLFFLIGLHHGFPVVAPRLGLPLRLLHGLPCDSGHKANSSSLFLFVLLVLFFFSIANLTCGSKVHKKRFVANLHHVTFEAHFQKWRATYASVIPDDMHVKLVEYLTDDPPCIDTNDPNARIITFCLFYFSVGFTFRLSKFFKKVLCSMECAPSQCNLNVYQAIMCFENLSSFFKLDMAVSADSRKARSAMFHLFPSFTAMKTQVGTASSSFAKVKHLVNADSKKIGDMQNVRDTPLKYLTDKLRNFNLPCREVCSRTSLPTERQRDIDIHPQISSRLYRSRDEDRTGRTNLPPNHCDPTVELRAVKHEADSMSLTLLEARMAVAKNARKSFARAKGFSELRIAGPKVDKSNSA